MKRVLLLVLCCVSGCASRRFCTGPMVPINPPAGPPARTVSEPATHGPARRLGGNRHQSRS